MFTKNFALLLSLVCISTASLFAQGGLGEITGRVTDASGAVVASARVTIINVQTNATVTVITSQSGDYTALDLVPGAYELSMSVPGFRNFHLTGIDVRVSDKLTVNAQLEVGRAADTVSVSADNEQLRTEDAQTGEVVTNKFIENLPQLNRDPLQLLRVSGDVQGDGSRATGGSDTRINGGRTSSIEYYIDGVPSSSGRGHGVSSVTPNMDDVAELKVITNGISAEYGRISGGLVEVVTKSGTNQIHGQLFEYIQNNDFNANSWYQNALGGARTPFRQNQFGFTLGGPVEIPKLYHGRNKTFFYADYQGLRFTQSGSLQVVSVPTAAERLGDFSNTTYNGTPTLMYDPNGPQVQGSDGVWIRTSLLGGDGKHVPPSMISPVAQALLALTPLPNRPSVAGSSSLNNYVAPTTANNTFDSWSIRLDQHITDNQRVYGRAGFLNSNSGTTRARGIASSAPENIVNGGFFTTLNYDWSISPTMLLNIRGGAHFDPVTTGNLLPAGTSSANIPLDSTTRRILGTSNLPYVQSVFMGGTTITDNGTEAITNSTTYEVSISMTKVLNRHTLKFGYEHRRYYDNFYNSASSEFRFQSNPVNHFAVDNSWNDQGFANGLGPFLLGINDRALASGATTRAMDTNYNGAYVQDDYKVTPKLTLNLGLRWDLESPATERHDKLYFWDENAPSAFHVNPGYNFQSALAEAGLPTDLPVPSWVTNGFPKGAIRIAGTPGFPARTGQSVNPHQFGPRIGVAYQLTPKTVFRGSYGLFYLSTTGDPNGLSSGGSGIALADQAAAAPGGWHASNDGLRHLISTFENPYPFPNLVTSYTRDNAVANFQASGGIGPGAFSRNSHQPHEQDWHAGIQRQLPDSFLLELDYSGNRGLGLLAPNLISRFPKPLFTPNNQVAFTTQVASPTAGQTPTDSVVGPKQDLAFLYFLMPYYGTVNVLGTNLGSSYFNALNVRLEKRYSKGLTLLVNYTLSRSDDNVGGPEANSGCICGGGVGFKKPQSVDTVASVYGLSAFDETHRLSLTYSYELPIGRGKPLLSSPQGLGMKLLDYAVGGWEFSGVSLYRSGRPLFLDNSNTNVNNNVRAEYTAGSWTTSDHNLAGSNYNGDSQAIYGPLQPYPSVTAETNRRFDPSKVTSAQAFVYGTLPAVYGNIRQPGNFNTDLSLMKKFPFGESRFVQIRGEASNAFNIRGAGSYNTTVGSDAFGLITSAGNVERRMQLSARIVF